MYIYYNIISQTCRQPSLRHACIYTYIPSFSLMAIPIISCRLSLQYHPDKNKNKGAQEKFAEINNGMVISYSFSVEVLLF
jgi:hypothetical protein